MKTIKTLIILSIVALSSCGPTRYKESSKFSYYGYTEKLVSDINYEIEYRVDLATPLKKCMDFALLRASNIALEKDKNFAVNKIEVYRSYEKNPKKLTGTFVYASAVGEKYALDRIGKTILEINLSKSGDNVSSCAICSAITKKYGAEFFKEDFCGCSSNDSEIKKAENFLEEHYSKFNPRYLDKVFGTINPFELDKVFNPHKETY
jgi:hypothetical protein